MKKITITLYMQNEAMPSCYLAGVDAVSVPDEPPKPFPTWFLVGTEKTTLRDVILDAKRVFEIENALLLLEKPTP